MTRRRNLTLPAFLIALTLAGCAVAPAPAPCPGVEPAKPAARPLQPADWSELPGWESEDHAAALALFRAQCATIARRPLWQPACTALPEANGNARNWFESQFRPWALTNPDGAREGLVTGYYEPVVRGSRKRQPPYEVPVFGPPEDLIVVDLAALYPELKNLRLRGRLIETDRGRKLVPFYDRAAWSAEEQRRADSALLWLDDPLDFFFLQIQGSGQVELDDGSRVRIGYADQNGHPYRSIGRWLAERGELPIHEASMQGIRAWAQANPQRLRELLNANPSLVFFRELPTNGNGPPGALGVPLTPERSIAVDPRHVPLGSPVWLATTRPNSEETLIRLVLAQDTGGAIRGPVRADFYWGGGTEAGSLAGKMRQPGRMWVLLPRQHQPE